MGGNVLKLRTLEIFGEGEAKGRAEGEAKGRAEMKRVFDILDRREEYPEESITQTAKAVGCTQEEVLAVVHRKRRSWKNESERIE